VSQISVIDESLGMAADLSLRILAMAQFGPEYAPSVSLRINPDMVARCHRSTMRNHTGPRRVFLYETAACWARGKRSN
jgi:hypothetical protein